MDAPLPSYADDLLVVDCGLARAAGEAAGGTDSAVVAVATAENRVVENHLPQQVSSQYGTSLATLPTCPGPL